MTSPWALGEGDQSANSLLNNCVIFDVNSTVPWDNPDNLISFEAWSLFDRIKSAILIPILFLIGIPANLLNLAVFFKQGLQERINLCLFTLALVDLLCLTVVLLIHADRIFTQFSTEEAKGAMYGYIIDNNVVGLYGFSHGSALLSAIIATERCVCVLFPLKAQRCIPTKVFAAILVLGVLAISLTRFAVSAMYRVACFYETRAQRFSWQLAVNDYYFQHQAMITALNGVFYGFVVTVGCPVVVLVTTVITGVKLTHTVRWRNQTSSSLSSKEIGVTKMLIARSVEFFVLSLPLIFVRIVPVFEPRFSAGEVYVNSFRVFFGMAAVCPYTTSSVNFFVYFFAGTKYRETFRSLFGLRISTKRLKTRKTSAKPGTQTAG